MPERPAVPGADPEDRPAAHRHPTGAGGACNRKAQIRGHEIAQISRGSTAPHGPTPDPGLARRRFVSDASHELKTPLAAIRLLTDSILQTDNIDRATAREFVADIGAEAERLSRITEDCTG